MTPLPRLDHLVYGTPDIEETVDQLERRTGVRAMYLEILGPDPEQPEPDEPRWLGIDDLTAPRLITWAATAAPLVPLVDQATALGIDLGGVQPAHRRRPDGVDLHWQLTDPSVMLADGLVPFFIDWGSGPHPADTAPSGVTFTALQAEHPEPDAVMSLLHALDLNMEVRSGNRPALVAILECPKGTVELR